MRCPPVWPAFPLGFLLVPSGASHRASAVAAPWAWWKRFSQAVCQGQAVGRCSGHFPGVVGHPRRHVDQLSGDRGRAGPCVGGRGDHPGRAGEVEGMAAQTSQAALALNIPEGWWASGPALRSAMTCSMIAWSPWEASASSIARGESVNTAWCRQATSSSSWPEPRRPRRRRSTGRPLHRRSPAGIRCPLSPARGCG